MKRKGCKPVKMDVGGPLIGGPASKIKFNKNAILDSLSLQDQMDAVGMTTGDQDRMKAGIHRSIDFGGTPGAKTAASGAAGVPGTVPATARWAGSLKGLVPYASNVFNALQKPPKPTMPVLLGHRSLSRINLDGERNAVERATRAADLSADRTLDSNTAAAVRNANLATKIQGLNDVAAKETSLNLGQENTQAQMDAGVDAANANLITGYRDNVTNSVIARQRAQSSNIANANDKYIAMENEKAKGQLEMKKLGVLSYLWKNSGVYDRMLKGMKEAGLGNVTGIGEDGQNDFKRVGGYLRSVMAEGGPLSEDPKVEAANAEAKRFAVAHGLMIGANAHTGGKVPAYVDPSGKPYQPAAVQPLPTTVPDYVNINDIQTDGTRHWYTDAHTGDLVDISPLALQSSRLRAQSAMLAKKRFGGKLKPVF